MVVAAVAAVATVVAIVAVVVVVAAVAVDADVAGDGVVVIVAVARRWNSQHGASSMEQPEQTPEIARKSARTHEHKQLQQPY